MMYDAPQSSASVDTDDLKIRARGVQVYYGDTHAIKMSIATSPTAR